MSESKIEKIIYDIKDKLYNDITNLKNEANIKIQKLIEDEVYTLYKLKINDVITIKDTNYTLQSIIIGDEIRLRFTYEAVLPNYFKYKGDKIEIDIRNINIYLKDMDKFLNP